MGTSTLSGCTKTVTQPISVSLSPPVVIFSGNSAVCAGKSITLTAAGASIYNWSNGSNNASTVVTPTTTTTYTVIGINAAGCSSMVAQQITVNPLPTVNASGTRASMCVGESVTLTATGANNYQWISNSVITLGNPIVVSPNTSQLYNVVGTDAKGCSNSVNVVLEVNDCTGLIANSINSGIKVYPNPTNGLISVEFNSSLERTVEVTDVTGRVIARELSNSTALSFNLGTLSNGIYLVKIISSENVNVIKIVKHN
jgi:hypothetical protein